MTTKTKTRPYELDGYVATASEPKPYSGRSSRHLVFVDGAPDPDMPMPPYGRKGDDAANDKARRAYNRREVEIMRAAAAEALDVDPSALKFSRKAGCSCPCSPGFRLDVYVPGRSYSWATWVQVTKAEDQ